MSNNKDTGVYQLDNGYWAYRYKINVNNDYFNNISIFIFPSPLYTHCYMLILFYIFRYFLTMEL